MPARRPLAPGRDEIVAALRRLAKRLGRTPRSTEVRRNAPEVYRALFQHFRHSIAAAVEGAGLAAVGLPRKWSRELVVAELRRLHRRGEGVSRRKLIEAGRYDLVNAIVTYCGGMTAARRVARLPPAASGPAAGRSGPRTRSSRRSASGGAAGCHWRRRKFRASSTTRPGTPRRLAAGGRGRGARVRSGSADAAGLRPGRDHRDAAGTGEVAAAHDAVGPQAPPDQERRRDGVPLAPRRRSRPLASASGHGATCADRCRRRRRQSPRSALGVRAAYRCSAPPCIAMTCASNAQASATSARRSLHYRRPGSPR